jgi:hypothetical protein
MTRMPIQRVFNKTTKQKTEGKNACENANPPRRIIPQ